MILAAVETDAKAPLARPEAKASLISGLVIVPVGQALRTTSQPRLMGIGALMEIV